ncbi:MAG: hypothetical protein V2J89_07995 [Halieaceae bacterium]|nr:hypothetical protein [Halieaceae bacterium]
MKQLLTVLSTLAVFSALPVLADENKLSNDKLKSEGFERLEGNNPFKPGCRHIIRSDDRQIVMHPTVLSNQEIGLHYKGRYAAVKATDKTSLSGADFRVTVWRNCSGI